MLISKHLIITPKYTRYGSLNGVDTKLVQDPKNVSISANAVVMKLNLDLPDNLFKKPALSATIRIDKSAVSAPVISADVLDNITAELQKTLGVHLTVNVVDSQ